SVGSSYPPGFVGVNLGHGSRCPAPSLVLLGVSHCSSARWSFITTVPPGVRCLPIDACFQGWPRWRRDVPDFLPASPIPGPVAPAGKTHFARSLQGQELRLASSLKRGLSPLSSCCLSEKRIALSRLNGKRALRDGNSRALFKTSRADWRVKQQMWHLAGET